MAWSTGFEHEKIYRFTFDGQDAVVRSHDLAKELEGTHYRIIRREVAPNRVVSHLAERGRAGVPAFTWWEVLVRVPSTDPTAEEVTEASVAALRAEYERYEALGKRFGAMTLEKEDRMYRAGLMNEPPD